MARFKDAIGSSDLIAAEPLNPQESTHNKVIFRDTLPTIKELTEILVDEAMLRAENNQSIAARMLGISHQALNQRLKKRETQ